jgi:hypothetical protein
VSRAAGRRHRIHYATAQDRGLIAAEDDKLEILPERTVEVRETRTLFRLAPAETNLSRSSQQVAIVAADTEDEARQIASLHDAIGVSPPLLSPDLLTVKGARKGHLLTRSHALNSAGR